MNTQQKKTYLTPHAEILPYECQNMIAASGGGNITGDTGDFEWGTRKSPWSLNEEEPTADEAWEQDSWY